MQLFYPFEIFAKWLTFKVLNLTPASLASEAAEFFIFDTLKIFFLLFTLIFLVAVFRSHLTEARIKKILSHDKKHAGNVLAACLGILVPFCSCSAIPLFLSFLEAGVPVGITFSFLIASPMINEIAVIMLLGLFGVKITLIYILSGLAISIIAGILLGKMHVEKWILSDMIIQKKRANQCACSQGKARVQTAFAYTVSIIRKIGLYVLLGIGVGAWIHGYVPEDFLAKYADAAKWYDVPLAVLLGIPLYSNAAGIIPLINSLTEKGLSIGTALAFMMAVTGLSLPEMLILKRIMRWKLIALFAGIVGIGIIFTGYLFNAIF